jgi:Golgi nucleoside diphosphatase
MRHNLPYLTLGFLSLCYCFFYSSKEVFLESYAIVLDAGSTGTRGFIFKFTKDRNNKRSVKSYKGKKVEPGISSFSSENLNTSVIEYLFPVFIDAKRHIPEKYHNQTPVYIKGTAGMRLLPAEQQLGLWTTLYNGFVQHPEFPFIISKANMGTIDGQYEAFYAVISSNYIEGSIDAELIPQPNVPM